MIRPLPSLLLYLTLFFFFSSAIKAQEIQSKEVVRPKIGLVLSGGGAKGLAHVGVLKVLEELDLQPDYITGTSMGAIVGGLYSIGYSANELDSITKAIDWNTVFSDKLSFDQVDINVKDDYTNYQLNLSGNKLKEIKLPLGVVDGQLISEMLSELTWRVSGIDSFDDFQIPFRCISADIVTGKQFIFDSGNLAHAIRASMSIPTAFTPILQDSMLLVDGGVLNNFPVEQCIAMGADIIIGVYVGSNENITAKDLNTMVKVLNQAASFSGVINVKEKIELLDIKIIPDLKGAGIESFNRADEIRQLGEDAARNPEVYNQLASLSHELKLISKNEIKSQNLTPLELTINKVKIIGLNHVEREFVISTSQIEENSLVNSQIMSDALKRLYGTLNFDKVEYRFEKSGSQYDLIIEVIEKDPIALNTSIYYDNHFGAGIFINASYKHLLQKSSRLDLIIDVSKFPRLKLSYSIFGGKRKRLFYTLGLNAQSIVIPNYYEFPNSLVVSMGQFRNNQFNIYSSVGIAITKNSKLELKASHTSNFFQLQGGLEDLYGVKNVSSSNFSIEGSFKINTFDHPVFPTKGAKFNITYKSIHNPISSYTTSEGMFKPISDGNEIVIIDYKQYFRFAKRVSIIPELTLGYMSSIPFYADKFFLGGSGFNNRANTYNISGVLPYNIATDNFIKFGIGIQLKLIDNWYINAVHQEALFINNAETSFEQSLEIESERISGWAGSLGYNSPLGPLKFTITQNLNNSKFYYYFSLGFPF